MGSQNRKSNVNDQIRKNLQRVYDEALNEELPDAFVQLVDRLCARKSAEPEPGGEMTDPAEPDGDDTPVGRTAGGRG